MTKKVQKDCFLSFLSLLLLLLVEIVVVALDNGCMEIFILLDLEGVPLTSPYPNPQLSLG